MKYIKKIIEFDWIISITHDLIWYTILLNYTTVQGRAGLYAFYWTISLIFKITFSDFIYFGLQKLGARVGLCVKEHNIILLHFEF